MSLKKIAAKTMMVILVMVLLACPAYAVKNPMNEPQNSYGLGVSPRWVNIKNISPYISASGNTLYPEADISAKSSTAKITGTMYLEKYASGKWSSVTSWSISGTGSAAASGSYTGTTGVKYRTRVVAKVGSESAGATSASITV